MSSSDPRDNPYAKNPYGDSPHDNPYDRQPPQQPGQYPAYPQSGASHPYGGAGDPNWAGGPGGTPTTMPGKVNTVRIMTLVVGGIQALFSLLVIIALAVAVNDLEEVYGDLGVNAGFFYFFFGASLVHAIVGVVLATRFSGGGGNLRIAAIVWSALLIVIGLAAFPLGLLWMGLGVVCVVLLASAESAAWFNRDQRAHA